MKPCFQRALVLILMLALSLAFPALGDASGAAVLLETGQNGVPQWSALQSEAVANGKLYCLDGAQSTIYEIGLGGDALRTIPAAVESADGSIRTPILLLSRNERLFAIEINYAGSEPSSLGLYEIHCEERLSDSLLLELPLDGLIRYDGAGMGDVSIAGAARCGAQLLVGYETQDSACCRAYAVGGQMRKVALPGLRKLIQFDDSCALVACEDAADGLVLSLLRADTLELRVVRAISAAAHALAYRDGKLYYIQEGAIWSLALDGAAEPEKYANALDSLTRGVLLDDGRYLAGGRDRVMLYSREQVAPGGANVLSISGNTSLASVDAWAALHPEIRVQAVQGALSIEDYVTAFLTKSSNIDVYFFTTINLSPYQALRDRGYLPAIQSDAVQALVASLYPELRDFVTFGGEVVAVPVACTPQIGIGVNRAAWSAIGRTAGDLPRTWLEFLTFAAVEWPQIAAQYPDVRIFSDGPAERDTLYYDIMNAYECLDLGSGNINKYTRREFSDLMEMFARIPFDDETLMADESFDGDILFTSAYDADPAWPSSDYSHLLLHFFSKDEPNTYVSLTLGILNPYSGNIGTATELLGYAATQIEAADRLRMCPDSFAEGLRKSNYEQLRQECLDEIDALRGRLEAETEPVERSALEMELSDASDALNQWERKQGWVASPEDIAAYRTPDRKFAVYSDEALSQEDERRIDALHENYLNGSVPLDQLLSTLDRILGMRASEGA